MKNVKNLSKKDLGAILYVYYLENYLEDDFSFDKGKTRKQIEKHYKKLKKKLTKDELEVIKSNIKVYTPDGTDYDSLEFRIKYDEDLFLQVTSLIDYRGRKVNGYNGNCDYADVGMFFVDYEDCDFKDLDE